MLYDPKWEERILVPASDWRRVLLTAASIVRTRGLAKNTQEDEEGRVCIHGAISIALHGDILGGESHCEAGMRLCNYLAARGVPELRGMDGAAYWNNEPARTAEEVIAALEGAARS
jgi:hypothetical protein